MTVGWTENLVSVDELVGELVESYIVSLRADREEPWQAGKVEGVMLALDHVARMLGVKDLDARARSLLWEGE